MELPTVVPPASGTPALPGIRAADALSCKCSVSLVLSSVGLLIAACESRGAPGPRGASAAASDDDEPDPAPPRFTAASSAGLAASFPSSSAATAGFFSPLDSAALSHEGRILMDRIFAAVVAYQVFWLTSL